MTLYDAESKEEYLLDGKYIVYPLPDGEVKDLRNTVRRLKRRMAHYENGLRKVMYEQGKINARIDTCSRWDGSNSSYGERKERVVYCDRNLCAQNEYNGIGCDECQKMRKGDVEE